MKIKKIRVNGFGKLKDLSLRFSDGLNVVYGGNESGKSTLHRFIGAVFFGLFKPYTKTRQYSPEYDRYLPWNTDVYGGSITYEKDQRGYTLYRNLLKSSEEVRLTDEMTGADITSSLEFDPVHRMYRTDRDIGVSRVLYENTVSIPQMKSATGEELASEIGELLVRAESTHTSDVSYTGALERIKKLREPIGTERQSRSRMGKASARLRELKDEYERSLRVRSEVEAGYMDIKALRDEDESLAVREDNLKDALRAEEALRTVSRYREMESLREDIARDEDLISKGLDIDDAEYERFVRAQAGIDDATRTLEAAAASEQKAAKALSILRERGGKLRDIIDMGPESVREDALLYRGLSDRLGKIKELNSENEKEALEKEKERYKKLRAIFAIVSSVFFLTGCVLILLSYLGRLGENFYIWGGAALAPAFILLGLAVWQHIRIKQIEPRTVRFDTLMQRSIALEVAATAQMDALLQKYSVKDIAGLERIFEKSEELKDSLSDYTAKINRIEAGLEALGNQKAAAQAKLNHFTQLMEGILEETGAPDRETLKQMVDISRRIDSLKERLAGEKKRLSEVMGEDSAEDIARDALSAQEMSLRAKDTDSSLSMMKLEEVRAERSEIASRISGILGAVNTSESSVRSPNVIDEEMEECERELEECRRLSAAYSLAEDTIIRISKQLHGDFSEIFNSYVSRVASSITGGRYTSVKVDENMHVTVWDEESGRYADISELSGATMDQMYFAVRFAIADLLIEDKEVPIFLDDCFVQYDDERLKNILGYLGEVSRDRQVILFTCRPNEIRCLDEIGVEYKEIDL